MSDIEIHHLGAAYALDALDERERLAFEAHATTCEICRTDVREFRAAAADLGALTAAPPPARLRAGVLAEIAETRQLSPLPGAVVRLADRRRSRALAAALAVAAAAVCFVLGAIVVGGRGGDGFDETVAAMMKEPDARLVRLDGDGGAALQVLWTGDRVALSGAGLPEPPAGTAYELWLIDAAGATPMQVLDRDGGTVERVVDIDAAPTAWGITIEPEGGSAVPTMPILYAAEV